MTVRLPATREEPPSYGGPLDLGKRGEDAAAEYLIAYGFRILERRFRTRAGEIDLVAEEGETLVFVEVKARASIACGFPAEAVGRRKRARLVRAASLYLVRRPGPERPCRFDVVEILHAPGRDPRVRLIRDAFQAE